jgi:hypothetical protein
MPHNPALHLAPYGRWTLRDKAAQEIKQEIKSRR